MFGLADVKTPALWLISAALAGALAALGGSQVQLAGARADLAREQAARATETSARATLAASDQRNVAAAQGLHAAEQQEITNDLVQAKQDLAAARAGRLASDQRLRDTAAALGAARAQLEAGGDAAEPGSCRDQLRATRRLLEEGGQLAVELGLLAREGQGIVEERDAEVAALIRQVGADRRLMLGARGLRIPSETTGWGSGR